MQLLMQMLTPDPSCVQLQVVVVVAETLLGTSIARYGICRLRKLYTPRELQQEMGGIHGKNHVQAAAQPPATDAPGAAVASEPAAAEIQAASEAAAGPEVPKSGPAVHRKLKKQYHLQVPTLQIRRAPNCSVT